MKYLTKLAGVLALTLSSFAAEASVTFFFDNPATSPVNFIQLGFGQADWANGEKVTFSVGSSIGLDDLGVVTAQNSFSQDISGVLTTFLPSTSILSNVSGNFINANRLLPNGSFFIEVTREDKSQSDATFLRFLGTGEQAARLDGQIVDPADFTNAVPEPATWLMMLAGFALAGVALKRREGALAAA